MEVKNIHMTDEYAAHYLLQQGYLAGRIEAVQANTRAINKARLEAMGVVFDEEQKEESNGD